MKPDYKNEILKNIFDFFQYYKKGDKIILSQALDLVEYNKSHIIFHDTTYEIGDKNTEKKLLGFFLANLPMILIESKNDVNELTPKLMKLKEDTADLISLNRFNELPTLEMYLLLEMGLRCLYSKWLGQKVVIARRNHSDVILYNQDYRRIKLFLRLNRIGYHDIRVNGEPFPNSQNSLLYWAGKFLDRNSDLLFRLAVNVRNLLAHGENEWELYPTIESLGSSVYIVGRLIGRIHAVKN